MLLIEEANHDAHPGVFASGLLAAFSVAAA
jgi:hypothetical protein